MAIRDLHLVLPDKSDPVGLTLVSPEDDLLVRLTRELVGRKIAIRPLCDALNLGFPLFVKPVVPKQFRAELVLGCIARATMHGSG